MSTIPRATSIFSKKKRVDTGFLYNRGLSGNRNKTNKNSTLKYRTMPAELVPNLKNWGRYKFERTKRGGKTHKPRLISGARRRRVCLRWKRVCADQCPSHRTWTRLSTSGSPLTWLERCRLSDAPDPRSMSSLFLYIIFICLFPLNFFVSLYPFCLSGSYVSLYILLISLYRLYNLVSCLSFFLCIWSLSLRIICISLYPSFLSLYILLISLRPMME